MFKTSIVNIALRGITLASKFLLMITMAKYLHTDDVGVYGLFTAAISIALYFLGMDFYTYTNRQIFSFPTEEWALLVRDQFVFFVIVYVIGLPLLLFVFIVGLLSWKIIFYFYIILLFEHISQELYRLLINISRPIQANIVLFLRGGVWIYAVIALSLMGFYGLSYIWIGWIIGLCGSIILSAYFLRDMNWSLCLQRPINWLWIRKGVVVSLPYFIGTLLFKMIEFMERFILEYYHGSTHVGIYTFFFSMSNVVQVFVFTGIISILYPKILKSYAEKKYMEYKVYMKDMAIKSVAAVVFLSVCAYFGVSFVLWILNKPDYSENKHLLIFLLSAVALNVLSQMPHYSLYVRKKDKSIMFCSFVTFLVSLTSGFIIIPKYGLYGAAFCSIISMFVMLCSKCLILLYYKYLQKAEDANEYHVHS